SRESADGLCSSEYAACVDSIDCGDFLTCANGCAEGDSACYTSCETSYPTGSSIFNDYASCVICNDCYVLCDGAGSCI
ncbi:MAG TPA: latent transforming growth factor beta-binding protein, partial [Polyangium sp.]|nr:latent transforming growth factor beta-binding protein [Polyangium sp.]